MVHCSTKRFKSSSFFFRPASVAKLVSLAHDGNIRYNIPLAEVEAGLKGLLGADRRGDKSGASAPGGASARRGEGG